MKKKKVGNPNWSEGKSGNPHGRPKGSRTVAIDIIFRVFNEHGQETFEKDMKQLAKNNPIAFYLKFIQPIQPRDISIVPEDIEKITINITKSYAKK